MTVVVCLDDKNGMMFNNRRQSRDRAVIDDIIKSSANNNLRANGYSSSLFSQYDIHIDDNFLSLAEKDDFCFVENLSLLSFSNKIDRLIIYKWNRIYPADFYFDLKLSDFNLQCREEFAGFSHEIITKETYIK